MTVPTPNEVQGILLVNKPKGKTSFSLVASLRRRLGVRKIGHAGTLDPFATGVMVMLIGRQYTRLSDQYLGCDKEYLAQIHLGIGTDTFDCEGVVTSRSDKVPTLAELNECLKHFQGEIDQVPPMFSAKKVNGKKLYELARKGKSIERKPVKVSVDAAIISYQYPYVNLHVKCSKGTYIRSLANDLANMVGSGGHLSSLQRVRSGPFRIEECVDGERLLSPDLDIGAFMRLC